MNQKRINAILFACIIALSLVCYLQNINIKEYEWSVSDLEYEMSSQKSTIKDLEKEIRTLQESVDSLSEQIEEPVSYKSPSQTRQDIIERVRRFNTAREVEERKGIVNSDPKVASERQQLNLLCKLYKLYIPIK